MYNVTRIAHKATVTNLKFSAHFTELLLSAHHYTHNAC